MSEIEEVTISLNENLHAVTVQHALFFTTRESRVLVYSFLIIHCNRTI